MAVLFINVTFIAFFSVPTAPISVTARDASSTSVDVTWSPPTSPNGLISQYQVAYEQTVCCLSLKFKEVIINF